MDELVRDALEAFEKDELLDVIIENGYNGYFPLELFLLKSAYTYSADELQILWGNAYADALMMDRKKDSSGACYLADCSNMYFEQIRKLDDEAIQRKLAQKLVKDLYRACEEDGIGMYSDSEGMYMAIAEKIEKHYEISR